MSPLSSGWRSATKVLSRDWVFTSVTILSLGLGVAVASLTGAASVRSQQSPEVSVDRTVSLYPINLQTGRFTLLSYPEYVDLRDSLNEQGALAAFGVMDITAVLNRSTIRGTVGVVSGNYFDTLNARSILGRLLTQKDDTPGAELVAVLSDRTWSSVFNRDPAVLGRSIRLGGFEFAVVGVAGNPLAGPQYHPDFWISLSQTGRLVPDVQPDPLKGASAFWLGCIARLHPRTQLGEFGAAVNSVTTQLQDSRRGKESRRYQWRLQVLPLNRVAIGPAKHQETTRLLSVLSIMCGLFLAAAIFNVGLMFASRIVDRQHELRIRAALGATNSQMRQLFLPEVFTLTSISAGFGIIALPWIGRILQMPQLPESVATVDRNTLATLFAATAIAGTSICAILAISIRSTLATSGYLSDRVSRATRPTAFRQGLMIAQIVMACVLLIFAMLLATSANAVATIPLGFTPQVVIAQLLTPEDGYPPSEGVRLYQRLQSEVSRLPSVTSVGLAWHAPLSDTFFRTQVTVPNSRVEAKTTVEGNVVSPGFFATLGIRLIEGRDFSDSDNEIAPRVGIVSQTLALRWWGTEFPVNKEIILSSTNDRIRVVGVVDDVRHRTLTEAVQPLLYLPVAQQFMPWMFVHVRTLADDPLLVSQAVRSTVSALDPRVGMSEATTLDAMIQRSVKEWSGPASLATCLASLTLLLAICGIYGLTMGMVQQRTKDIAIRRALGARNVDVQWLIARRAVALAAFGVVLGVLVSAVIAPGLNHLLYSVTSHDVMTYCIVSAVLIATVFIGSAYPARRAAKLDPMLLLRSD